jgi:hypothetical protein
MAQLKNVVGKLWRKSPDNPKHMTLFGYQELTKIKCKVCGNYAYLSEAYPKSKSQQKHGSDMRPYHANCYINTNGKYLPEKEPSTGSLFEFLKD